MEEIFFNSNFRKFKQYGKEIDSNFRRIQFELNEFGNSPFGNERLIVKITRDILEKLDYLK